MFKASFFLLLISLVTASCIGSKKEEIDKEISSSQPNSEKDEPTMVYDAIKKDIEKANSNCPSPWDNGFRLMSVTLKNINGQNFYNYEYEIEDEISEALQNDDMKEAFLKNEESYMKRRVNSNDEVIVLLIANCGYRYHYFSKKHSDGFEIIYLPSQLKDMITDSELKSFLENNFNEKLRERSPALRSVCLNL